MAYEPIPRWKQRLGGVFIALLGAGFTGWSWYTALNEGYYYGKASMALFSKGGRKAQETSPKTLILL